MSAIEDMDERYHRHVAAAVQKIVNRKVHEIARRHGGAPVSLCEDEAWRLIVADMNRRELLPADYVEAVSEEATA